ncbi:hypothetical protein T492DRAFT_1018687 [Pavlovales sp. CCMP2436]|nr:hypothetical protein T492DRAFT_1018687 [Pavlovales sp. CCMP2436]|mmetsp:Transcript_5629/g.14077  ORF Transcript_5629/g.14077 Transcript_5629/m.14077 type:complete len:172 (+) Transcript_5629:73-588(+)
MQGVRAAMVVMVVLGVSSVSGFRVTTGCLSSSTSFTSTRASTELRPRVRMATVERFENPGPYPEEDTEPFFVNDSQRETLARVMGEADRWRAKVQTPEVQELRQMLVAQYHKLGRDDESAALEIDSFLADQSRSKTWVRSQLSRQEGWSQLPVYVAILVSGALLKYVAEML